VYINKRRRKEKKSRFKKNPQFKMFLFAISLEEEEGSRTFIENRIII